MGRTDSLAKLALAYGLHLTRRRLTPATLAAASAGRDVRSRMASAPLTPAERERAPAAGRLHQLRAVRSGGRTPRQDATTRPRLVLHAALRAAWATRRPTSTGDEPDLEAASAACPVGLPLDEVAAIVRRLATG